MTNAGTTVLEMYTTSLFVDVEPVEPVTLGPPKGALANIEEEGPQPAFDDIEDAFSPDYLEP